MTSSAASSTNTNAQYDNRSTSGTPRAKVAEFDPKKPFRILRRSGPLIERAMSNLDAAEAQILNLAPPSYLYGQLPSLLRNVQCHLIPTDPSRQEFERIARKVGVKDPDHPAAQNKEPDIGEKKKIVEQERGKIVTTVRAASSAKLREQVRVRSFRNVLVLTIIFMILLAIGVALLGLNRWTLIPPVLRSSGGWRNDSRVPNRPVRTVRSYR